MCGVWLKKGGCSAHVLNINDDKDPLENIVTRFQFHPSIMAISQNNFKEVFDFTLLTTEEVLSELNNLDPTKSTTGISISLLRDNNLCSHTDKHIQCVHQKRSCSGSTKIS